MQKYRIQLYLEKGYPDWQGQTHDEDMYIVVDKFNIDALGEFMPIKEALKNKNELINQI
jgi:hypothetical protein